MRRIAVAALAVSLGTACAGIPSTTGAPRSTLATASSITTTTPTINATGRTTTAIATIDEPPAVDMVPTGSATEDLVPLVQHYFAVRNWVLEHPGEATEELLASAIEPGSVEMRDTMAEIQSLLDEDAHYEGLTETFELRSFHLIRETTSDERLSIGVTFRFGHTTTTDSRDTVLAGDTLRSLTWTLVFVCDPEDRWRVGSTLRNAPVYPRNS